jgi:hypothetical protein
MISTTAIQELFESKQDVTVAGNDSQREAVLMNFDGPEGKGQIVVERGGYGAYIWVNGQCPALVDFSPSARNTRTVAVKEMNTTFRKSSSISRMRTTPWVTCAGCQATPRSTSSEIQSSSRQTHWEKISRTTRTRRSNANTSSQNKKTHRRPQRQRDDDPERRVVQCRVGSCLSVQSGII